MIVRFSISPVVRVRVFLTSGKMGSRNHTYLFRKTRRASRKREEGGEKEGDCGSPLNIPWRSLPSRFQKNCRWTMIFVASGASSPWRISSYCQREHTKDRTCVEANQFDDHQREERLNSMNMLHTNAHMTTQIHAHIKYIRTEDTHTRTHADAMRVRSCKI